jgi:transposase
MEAPKKRPGSKPKLEEGPRRLLEADLEERPAATLPQRREFLERACGVSVSDSTISRVLKRLGWSRKKGLRVLRPWCSRRLALLV